MTREDAILHMTLRREELKHSVGDLDEDIKAFDMAIEALEQIWWISVSERLPDECDYRSCYEVEDGAVLWTNEEGLVGMGYYYESTKTWSDIEDNPIAVIAWMPLPQPYKGESEESDADND